MHECGKPTSSTHAQYSLDSSNLNNGKLNLEGKKVKEENLVLSMQEVNLTQTFSNSSALLRVQCKVFLNSSSAPMFVMNACRVKLARFLGFGIKEYTFKGRGIN